MLILDNLGCFATRKSKIKFFLFVLSAIYTNFGANIKYPLKFKKEMKKFLLTLMVAVFAVGAMSAQANKTLKEEVVVEKKMCKDHKDGQPCTKPADQQCPDCKAKAAAPKHECKHQAGKECDKANGQKCEKAEGMKCEGKKCEKAEGKKCEKAEGMKCKHEAGKECDKAKGMNHECKKGEGMKCDKAEGKKCEKAEGKNLMLKKNNVKKLECKDHKDGQPCTKPADQQCPDCKDKAAKKD